MQRDGARPRNVRSTDYSRRPGRVALNSNDSVSANPTLSITLMTRCAEHEHPDFPDGTRQWTIGRQPVVRRNSSNLSPTDTGSDSTDAPSPASRMIRRPSERLERCSALPSRSLRQQLHRSNLVRRASRPDASRPPQRSAQTSDREPRQPSTQNQNGVSSGQNAEDPAHSPRAPIACCRSNLMTSPSSAWMACRCRSRFATSSSVGRSSDNQRHASSMVVASANGADSIATGTFSNGLGFLMAACTAPP